MSVREKAPIPMRIVAPGSYRFYLRTNEACNEWLFHLPLYGKRRTGGVRTEGPRFDRLGEMLAEGAVMFGDPRDGRFEGHRHVESRSLRRRSRFASPPA